MTTFTRKSVVSACALVILGCGAGARLTKPHRVNRQDLAGSTYVTVLSIAPWDEYAEALQPKFTLTVEDALAKSIANTRDEDERFLQSLSIAAKVSTPATSSTTATATTGTSTTTTTTDRDATNITHDTNLDATTLPAGTKALDTALDKEPMLQYLVATSLYQEVQLLSRYVKDAAKRRNMIPYVVRLQVTVMPQARNEPYDAYSNISFFLGAPIPKSAANSDDLQWSKIYAQQLYTQTQPTSKYTQSLEFTPRKPEKHEPETPEPEKGKPEDRWDAGLPCSSMPTPVIAPLLVTDNLEGAVHGQTSEYVRQFVASVLLLQADYSASATGRFRSDLLRSVLGRDINSLLTVARVNDSTLRVRLGAIQAPTGSYAMVPQTHNVTVLLMVPKKEARADDCVDFKTVRFVSKTTFVDANNGSSLPERNISTEAALIRRVTRALDDYGVTLRWSPLQEVRGRYLNLALFAATNNRQAFRWEFHKLLDLDPRNQCVEPENAKLFKPCLSAFTRDVVEDGVWGELVNLSTGGPYHIGTVELPKVNPPKFPDPYAILLADDGKKAVAQVNGCTKLVKGAPKATLTMEFDNGSKRTLLPNSIDVPESGESLSVTFPSPTKFLPPATDINKTKYTLTLDYPENPRADFDETAKLSPVTFTNEFITYLKPDAESPSKPPARMIISSDSIRSFNGEGKLNIEFERLPAAKEIVRFDVSGGDIADMAALPATMFVAGQRIRTIAASGLVTLTLRNLSDGQPVTITLKTVKDGEEAQLGDPKMLVVRDTAKKPAD